MGENDGRDAFAELREATTPLAARFAAGCSPEDDCLAPELDRHLAWVEETWNRECTPMAYAGLADLYLTAPGFSDRFEAQGTGFTLWLASAMKAHAARLMP